MAATATDRTERLDAAWQRFVGLRAIFDRQRGDGTEASVMRLAEILGTVARNGRRADTLKTTRAALDDMALQIDRQALIELCGAFEATFKDRLPTARGEAAKLLREHYKLPVLQGVRDRLVIEATSLERLGDILAWLEPGDSLRAKALSALRRARNSASHGQGAETRPTVTPNEAYKLLASLIIDLL